MDNMNIKIQNQKQKINVHVKYNEKLENIKIMKYLWMIM